MSQQSDLELNDTTTAAGEGPVTCLGMSFDSEEARRAWFTEELRKKLQDPEFRKIEGFPIGEDEDILALSDPPYYTACPNPWVDAFTSHYGNRETEQIVSEPYSGDLTATRRHPVYSFHPYHTKVPPSIIKELITHYTAPNDLVLDIFCGSGMTGVAARECRRNVIVNDLSPIATFISSVSTSNFDQYRFKKEFEALINESEKELGWVYETKDNNKRQRVNYFVWTDVFNCPECVYEFPFFPYAVIHDGNKVKTKKSFPCPSCDAELNVRRVERILTTRGKKKSLAWVNSGSGNRRVKREPNEFDRQVVRDVNGALYDSSLWLPSDKIDPAGYSAKLAQLGDKGITDVTKFLSERNLLVFADLWDRMLDIGDAHIRNAVRACLTSTFTVISERQGYFGGGGGMSGNLYMPIVRMEKNIFDSLRRKIKKFIAAEQEKPQPDNGYLVTTQSATRFNSIADSSIDYIYTDPPFGANIIYSEMNLILESWLRVRSNNVSEAVIDETKHKEYEEYGQLMLLSFNECFRVLKPGRWLTVEFHNTQAAIWNLIQNTMSEAGFIVAQVCKLDKGSTTILADIRPGAVVQDLIISAYKPTSDFVATFNVAAHRDGGVWEFVSDYLSHLPVYRTEGTEMTFVAERDPRIIFDKMIAYYVTQGYQIPISNQEFQLGIRQRFAERDGMFFRLEETAEYDKQRLTRTGPVQSAMFVCDESSAIEWLTKALKEKPQTFQELHPQYLREIGGWNENEHQVDLRELLDQNFLSYNGKDTVPEQIHAYLSSNWKDLRNRPKDDPALMAKAKDRWYVPDPSKAGDLELLRERALLKEFEQYKVATKKLKVFRLEAVRAGFKKAWQNRDYNTITKVAEKIPNKVLEEDPKLLMWYDQAVTRLGDA